ncbi:hypothetical protein [Candidatus Nitrospira bockiana]
MNDLIEGVRKLLTEKEALALKERRLIESLNQVLQKVGYQIVPKAGAGATGRRRGRPPKIQSLVNNIPKRRGRPPKRAGAK